MKSLVRFFIAFGMPVSVCLMISCTKVAPEKLEGIELYVLASRKEAPEFLERFKAEYTKSSLGTPNFASHVPSVFRLRNKYICIDFYRDGVISVFDCASGSPDSYFRKTTDEEKLLYDTLVQKTGISGVETDYPHADKPSLFHEESDALREDLEAFNESFGDLSRFEGVCRERKMSRELIYRETGKIEFFIGEGELR